MKALWYKTWFDSKYYHILYHHRDEAEASEFLDKLIDKLPINKGSRIIDIGCGRGRHAIYLTSKGYEVDGIDLSGQCIKSARKSENEHLSFHVHDMRSVFQREYYDYVLNLFTSFGYFDKDEDDLRSLQSMADNLKKGGVLVLDYLNPTVVEKELVPDTPSYQETKLENVLFQIEKYINGQFIEKKIKITDENEEHIFFERVKILGPTYFRDQMEKAGLHVEHLYGDYELNTFDEMNSERMIFIARKI